MDSKEKWIKTIDKAIKDTDRNVDIEKIREAGYDIKNEVMKLENKYKGMLNAYMNGGN